MKSQANEIELMSPPPPPVPCDWASWRRQRAKRGHRPDCAAAAAAAGEHTHNWRVGQFENEIKIKSTRNSSSSSSSSSKPRRGRRREKIDCSSSPSAPRRSPATIRHLHLFVNLFVLLVAGKTVASTSRADQPVVSHNQQQLAHPFRLFKEHTPAAHADRWLRRIIIIPDDQGQEELEEQDENASLRVALDEDEDEDDRGPILRSRRHGPMTMTSQDEFATPLTQQDGGGGGDQDNGGPFSSEKQDADQLQGTDGGNQFDSEHSAASSLSAAAAVAAQATTYDEQQTSATAKRKSTNATKASGNKTSPTCDTLEDVEASRPPRTFGMILAVGYGIIFVLGLIGNVITLYVLWCKGKKRTAQDVLVANLAISDVLLCVFCVPIMPKYLIIDGYWTLGLELCKVVSFAQSTSVYMSTYSLIYIGWIRYKLIVHPLANKKWVTQKGYALAACALTWTTAIILTVPYTNKVRLSPQECEIMFCDEDWEAKNWRFFFSLFTTVFQFIIPLVVVGFFNRAIYARLDERAGGGHHNHQQQQQQGQNNHPAGAAPYATSAAAAAQAAHLGARKSIVATRAAGAGGGGDVSAKTAGRGGATIEPDAHTIATDAHLYNYLQHHMHPPAGLGSAREQHQNQAGSDVMAIKEHKQREKNRRMRKANNRLIFVVVVFAHSWLPLNLFNMIQDYFEELGHWKYLTTTFLVVHQIACSSVIWNPILYAWMSETYRSELRAALPKFLVAKLSSWLSDGPTSGIGGGLGKGGGGGAGHGAVHGPASTSVCTMHLNNNNNNTNGHHRRGSNLAINGHANLNQQPLRMRTELAGKAKSIDHISDSVRAQSDANCYSRRDCDSAEIQSLGDHKSEIILTQNNGADDGDNLTGGGRISPEVVSSD